MKIKKLISAAISCCLLLGTGIQSGFIREKKAEAAQKSRVSVHDPSIFKDTDGTYYVFGSHIDAAKSRDLQNWQTFTNGYAKTNNAIFGDLSRNLAGAFAWAGEDLEDCAGGFAVWAPDVIYNPEYVNTDGSTGAYMMYFCTSSTYMRSVIAFAVSKNAAGPYNFVDTLIYSGFTAGDEYVTSATKRVNKKYTSTNIDELIAAGQVTYNDSWFRNGGYNNQLFPNAIDPTVYTDADGKLHMCYGSWSGGIFTLDIDPKTGRCIHPKSGQTADGRMIDSYFGTKISGGYGKSGEAPYIRYNPDTGYYYLWVTYGGLTATGGYNMRVFRSKNPDGPFTDPAGRAAVLPTNPNLDSVGLKVMGNYKFSSFQTAYMAPGHNSVYRDDDGQWYLFNHTRFNNGTEYHEVRVHAIYFSSDGWPVTAPYEYSGDSISQSGYNESDIVGTYEYINHANDTSKTIYEGKNITLNADGTVSGAVTGTWSQSSDSADAVINIGGQTYYGVFLAMQDETGTGKKVMTFTAVGNNNQTIWGVQTKAYTGTDRAALDDYTNSDSQLIYNPETASVESKAAYLSGTELLSGVSYFIRNKNSNLLMEVKNGLTDNATNIQQWEMNKGPHHEWRITAVDDEYCRILLMSDESMCVAVNGNSAENGLNIHLEKYAGADNQLFKFIKEGSSYGIVSKCSGGTAGLDVYEWSTDNGGNINQWEFWGGDCQLWNVVPVYPQISDGVYSIRIADGDDTIMFGSNGVIQLGYRSGWKIESTGDGRYSIVNSGGYALTAPDSSGGMVLIKKYTGLDTQKFTVKCGKNGAYSFFCGDLAITSFGGGLRFEEDETPAQFVLEPVIMEWSVIGDVNADGEFSVADVVMLHNHIISATALNDWEAGDLNSDGEVNIFDFVLMRKLLLEII